MKRSVFIITKPLQYINATNISDQNDKIGLITDTFHNAPEIFKELKMKSSFWEELIFVESGKEAEEWVLKNNKQIDVLYTYSDYGFWNYLFLNRLKNTVKYVYEEGLGNYITGLRKKSLINNVLVYFNGLIGNMEFVGGSRYIDGLFVYHPEKVMTSFPRIRTKVFPFQKYFLDHLNTLPEASAFFDSKDAEIVNLFHKQSKVFIYLGTWFHNKTEEQIFTEKNVSEKIASFSEHVTIYKPHPHSGATSLSVQSLFTHTLSGGTMAELLFNAILVSAKELVVMHHSSSALTYFESRKNVIAIDLGLD